MWFSYVCFSWWLLRLVLTFNPMFHFRLLFCKLHVAGQSVSFLNNDITPLDISITNLKGTLIKRYSSCLDLHLVIYYNSADVCMWRESLILESVLCCTTVFPYIYTSISLSWILHLYTNFENRLWRLSTWFIFSREFIAIWGYLCLHMNYRISLLSSKIYSAMYAV